MRFTKKHSTRRKYQQGMSLLELSVVLLVLIALAGIVAPYIGGTGRTAMCQATDATLQAIKTAIMGGTAGPGFYSDTLGAYPVNYHESDYNLSYLLEQGNWPTFNPKTGVGWRGPYLMTGSPTPAGLDDSFSLAFDSSANPSGSVHTPITSGSGAQILDAWGRPIILQIPLDANNAFMPNDDYARLISAGPGAGIRPSEAALDTQISYDGSAGLPDASDREDDRVLYLRYPEPLAGGNRPCDQI